MGEEAENVIDYMAVLADMEAKKSALESAINALRLFLSSGPGVRPVDITLGSQQHVAPVAQGGEVPAGAFLGRSIPEAAKLYLSISKSKKTTREIAEALRKGGMETTSTNFENIVHAGLNRVMKNAGGFLRVGKAWALPEWYPAGMRVVQEKRDNRQLRKRKPRRSANQKPEAIVLPSKTDSTPPTNGHHPAKLWERAVAFINEHPTEEFTAKQLSDKFGIHPKVISMTLGRPLKQGLVRLSAPGTYAAVN